MTEPLPTLPSSSATVATDASSPYLMSDGAIDWARALRDYEQALRATIAARVGEYGAVDEVFQEVALAATRQSAPLRDPTKVGAWLYKIATIQSALYRRKAGRKRKLLKRYEEEVVVPRGESDANDPLDWLIAEERRELVRRALEETPKDERQILLLKYRDDKSYQEIAELLDATPLAVQSKLHRARKRLKSILNKYSE